MKFVKNIKIKVAALLIVTFSLIICDFLGAVQAALYKSKGDNIPASEIKYIEGDNEFTYFPESYRENLKALKNKHPNWNFMAVYTNLDWYESIAHESYEKGSSYYISTVPVSYSELWKKDGKNNHANGDPNWVVASKSAVGYCLDPRNWLSEYYIFQFEVLSWAKLSKTDLETAMKYLLPNMYKSTTYIDTNGKEVKMEKSYVDIIYEAGEQNNLNPLSIITKIKQEIGDFSSDGNKNPSASGKVEGYIGYYNYFNVRATDGANAIKNGLAYAKTQGWDTPEKSIKAGAATLYNDYIKYGQNTLYNQKFDISNIYKNAIYLYVWQYMTNILDPETQAQNVYSSYEKMGILESNFVFYIPVYDNMPVSPSSLEDNVDVKFTAKEESVKVIKCENASLNVRNGISQNNNVIETLNNDEKVTRLGVYSNGWAKIKLSSGLIGYVKNEFLEVIKIELPKEETTKPVEVKIEKMTTDKTSYEIEVGQEVKYSLKLTPENASDKNLVIKSSNEKVLKVDGKKLIGISKGDAEVTFSIKNNSEVDIYGKEITGNEVVTKINVKVNEIAKKYEISGLTINGNNIEKIGLETKLSAVISNIKLYNNSKVVAKDINGKEINMDSLIGNGTSISIIGSDSKEVIKYNITIKGDVNGDSKATAADYVLIKNQIMGSASLSDLQKLGADVNGDSKITAADYVLIKNHIMGTGKISN